MKTLKQYIVESEARANNPVVGDDFAINIREECLIESYVVDTTDDGIVIEGDDRTVELLEQYGYLSEGIARYGAVGSSPGMGYTVGEDADSNDPLLAKAVDDAAVGPMEEIEIDEAEYQGRKVPLGKPMRGDVKKFKVYVRKPNGSIVKVNFGHGGTSAKRAGQKTMRIRKSDPARRKNFRARHNCKNPGLRWKARYWSCRAW